VDRAIVSCMRTPALLARTGRFGPLLLPLVLWINGCSASPSSCTEIGCESEAVVTFPPALISGGYDLVIEGDDAMATARCADPSAPETADNPEGLRCDSVGFTLQGHPLADEREVQVTIIPTDGSDTTTGLVRLDAVDEITPNGPDCPPICVVRNGQLTVAES